MDLYNNHVGRRLAADAANRQLPPAVVVLNALHAGTLMTQPLKINAGSGGIGVMAQDQFKTSAQYHRQNTVTR